MCNVLVTMLRRASLHGAVDRLAFFAILVIFATFWRMFLPILILRQFVITPYNNIFDWSSGLGGDRSGHAGHRYPVTQPTMKILVRLYYTLYCLVLLFLSKSLAHFKKDYIFQVLSVDLSVFFLFRDL